MVRLLLIAMLICSISASGTNYYISASGSDSANGLTTSTAWATLAKVNSASFIAGDSILFRRGDSWTGQLTYLKGGISGNPIVYGAYGVGAKPIISGFQTLTGWTNVGGGVYSATTTAPNTARVVTLNGVLTGHGRYPNTGFLAFESSSSNTSITDNQMVSASNWTGAEAVIRTARWKLENKVVSFNATTGTFTFSAVEESLTPGWGYFLQNDLKTLDQAGEWYCKDGVFYMHFGGASPGANVVKVAVYDDLITISNREYTTVENLKITGANSRGININNASNNILINACDFEFVNVGAVYMYGSGTISNCSVNHALNRAFYVEGINSTVRSNSISNTGLIPGMGSVYTAISCTGNGTLIEKNAVTNTGYDGIHFTGNNITVKNNFVDNFCSILDDGGGIYTGGASYTGRLIDGNVVLNGKSAKEGTNSTSEYGFGIYLDEGAANISVSNNTVANCTNSGILLHFAASIGITANTVFNCGTQLYLSNNYASAYADMSNITITDNQLIAKEATQLCFKFLSVKNDLNFGSASGNVYARPIADTQVFSIDTYNTSATTYDLAGWKALSGYDANSTKALQAIASTGELTLEYNATAAAVLRPLAESKVDVKGVVYSASVTLQPYNSVILMKNYGSNPELLTAPVVNSSGKVMILNGIIQVL